jgi:CubicO group peptidase (beta-lactamase class C family)
MARAPSPETKLPTLDDGQALSVGKSADRLADWLAALHSNGTFNGTVFIAKNGKVCFERHYGFADLAGRVPLSGRSSFSLASASKPFTALGILLLAQAGKLQLDDTLGRHVPEMRFYDRITIRHLLHHISGLPDHVELADRHWIENVLLTMPDLIGLFSRHRPRAYFEPGEAFEYSNTGYTFLGEIIARASGSSYPAFMAEAIFKPLGMNDSAAFNLTIKECPLQSRVYGLRRNFGRVELCDLNFFDGLFGDGGIYASAMDLLRWDEALRRGTLLPCEIYEEAYRPGRLNNGNSTGYGFGWEIEPSSVVEHWGEWEGFAAHIRRDLKQHTLLVALSNLGPANAVDPVFKAIAAFVSRIDWSAANDRN